jgi:hypothetical protein
MQHFLTALVIGKNICLIFVSVLGIDFSLPAAKIRDRSLPWRESGIPKENACPAI